VKSFLYHFYWLKFIRGFILPRFSYELNEEEKDRRHMVWEKGLLELMQKLQKGPKAIDKSTNSYQVK